MYLRLCRELSFQEFQPVKAWALAQLLHMKRDTVTRALQILVTKGFLEREAVPRSGRREPRRGMQGVRAYRLTERRATGLLAPERAYKAS